MGARAISSELVQSALEKVLASSLFQGAGRSSSLLRFIVEEHAAGHADRLKEYTIGAEALGRGDSFDPRTDPIVRAEASRLRDRLERYYAAEGQADPVTIVLPKGAYVPEFVERDAIPRGRTETPVEPVEPLAAPVPSKPSHGRLIWFAIGALLTVSALGVLKWGRSLWPHSSPRPSIQFDVELKSGGVLGSEVGTDVVISPDGSRLVFVSREASGVEHMYTRALSQPQTTELKGTEDARNPFFSPNGEWVAFWAQGKLKKTPVDGGSPVALCNATDELGGDWSPDGSIVASLGGNRLWRIPAAGGAPTVLLDTTNEKTSPLWPQFLPSGDLLFTNVGLSGPNGARIEVVSPATGKRTVLARGGTFGRYLENGYLTYLNQGTLFAVRFDLVRRETRGTPAPVLEHIAYSPGFGYAQLSFSRTGALIYRKDTAAELIIEARDQAGRLEPILARPGHYLWLRISPDGRRLAFSVNETGVANTDVFDRDTGETVRLQIPGVRIPLWTKDGHFLILGGFDGMSWMRPDAGAKPVPLLKASDVQIPWSISTDGRRLAFHRLNPVTGFDLWTVPIQSSADGITAGTPEPYLQTPAFETYPSFSPDGKWISYASNESGAWEVYVRAFPDRGQKARVSPDGGRISFWSPNRRELFYRTDDQRIMAATYSIRAGSFSVQSVRQWAPTRLADTGVLANLDLSPDGQKFIYLVPADTPENQQTENHATFISDFFSEISQRIP